MGLHLPPTTSHHKRAPFPLVSPATDSKAPNVLPKITSLWCTDIDGTLFEDRHEGIEPDVAKLVAQWLAAGGEFRLASAGSLQGLKREKIDIISAIVEQLNKIPWVRDPLFTVKELVTFHLSNGAATYKVLNPSKGLNDEQVVFVPQLSHWITEGEGRLLQAWLKEEGLEVLAVDADRLPNNEKAYHAFFLRSSQASEPQAARQFEANINTKLEAKNAPLRIVWLGGKRGRFDGFPCHRDVMRNKGDIVKSQCASHHSIVFTGDRCEQRYEDGSQGSDYHVCKLQEQLPLTSHSVTGPKSLCRTILPHLIAIRHTCSPHATLEALLQTDPMLQHLATTYS